MLHGQLVDQHTTDVHVLGVAAAVTLVECVRLMSKPVYSHELQLLTMIPPPASFTGYHCLDQTRYNDMRGCYRWAKGSSMHRDKPYTFNVTFPEAEGIEAGVPLRLKGVRVGEVQDVAVDMHTGNSEAEAKNQVQPGYTKSVYRDPG
eukprot:scaffold15233_cov16-Tisochrysis_lutea.AAC.1